MESNALHCFYRFFSSGLGLLVYFLYIFVLIFVLLYQNVDYILIKLLEQSLNITLKTFVHTPEMYLSIYISKRCEDVPC